MGLILLPIRYFRFGLDSTTSFPGREQVTQHLHMRQSMMPNSRHGHRVHNYAKMKDMCAALGQRHAVQTMDQQLYAIAQQVKWALPDELGGNVLRIGGFHTLSCFIARVCTFWGHAGLLDFLVDSGLYAASTADQLFAGKQFNRAVRGLTLAYQTLIAMKLAAFAW